MQHTAERMRLSTRGCVVALSRVNTALMGDLKEASLFQIIAETARDLTGASFVSIIRRAAPGEGQPGVPSAGSLFALAAVVGVTPEQQALLCRTFRGDEGVLASLFCQGQPVLVPDLLAVYSPEAGSLPGEGQTTGRAVKDFDALRHWRLTPIEAVHAGDRLLGYLAVRSVLGVPLLDCAGQVQGGLLLGHTAPGYFTDEDELVLIGLATQTAAALEKAARARIPPQPAQASQLAVLDAMTDGVVVYDHEGGIVHANAAAIALFALDALPGNAGRSLPDRSSQMVVSDSEGHALAEEQWPLRRLLQGEVLSGAGTVDVIVTAPDGRQIQVNLGGAPIRDSKGVISGAVLIAQDVTERIQLERHLRDAEREARERATQLEAIFNALTDALFVYDASGHIVQTNQAARLFWDRHLPADLAQWSMSGRVAQVPLSAVDGQLLADEQMPIARILVGEVLTPENAADIVFPSLVGRDVYASVTGGPMRDARGALIGAVSIVRDVTERRLLEQIARRVHAEAEARQSLLQLILDELPSSVYLVRGYEARLVLANRATLTMWGKPWLVGQPMGAFLREHGIRILAMDGHMLPPEQWATMRALQHGETVLHHQEIILHPDGTALPVMVNALELSAPNLLQVLAQAVAQPVERWEPVALVVHHDLTTLKEAERLKDAFLSVAAHELRNPLAVLKGYAHMLLLQTARGQGSPLLEWQWEALQEIDQATDRLDVLTADLLDVTRLQAGQLILHLEPTDLVTLVQRVVRRMQLTTERHALLLHSTRSHLVVQADAGRLEQVFTNLISNAIKYSPDGGPVNVDVSYKKEMEQVLVSVLDKGIGIPEQQQACIFGRFERAENARVRGIGGTGLGLYISRTLVELHGGHLWFKSEEGQGSTFFLTLAALSA